MKNILIVENDDILGKMYKTLLENHGYKTADCDSAMGALSHLRKNNFDLVLLDIMLEGKVNGFDLLEIMKKDVSLKDKKVIIMTNLENEEKVAAEIGADGYFVKLNTKPEALLEKIEKLLK